MPEHTRTVATRRCALQRVTNVCKKQSFFALNFDSLLCHFCSSFEQPQFSRERFFKRIFVFKDARFTLFTATTTRWLNHTIDDHADVVCCSHQVVAVYKFNFSLKQILQIIEN